MSWEGSGTGHCNVISLYLPGGTDMRSQVTYMRAEIRIKVLQNTKQE